MSEGTIRIGVVGAGANTRSRHIPLLQKIPGVEIAAVANRRPESTERVAKEFGIPRTFRDWEDLVASDEIDAVVIGTWPYLHCPVTLAALDAGKHVLTEARMAMNAAEAHKMLAASREHPELTAQVVPAPFTLRVDAAVKEMVADGTLGDLLAANVRGVGKQFIDHDATLHWRQEIRLSGLNVLAMGIWQESLERWVGGASRVLARARIFVREREDMETGHIATVHVPDHIDIIADLECGAQANYQFSAVEGFGGPNGITLYGSEATLAYEADGDRLLLGRRGDERMEEVSIPPEKAGGWRVEEEFIGAIRGEEPVRLTTFEDAVRYMEFTEAVARSVVNGCTVDLPLRQTE